MSNITVIKDEIYALRDTFQTRLTNKSMSFEVEAGFAVQQLEGNDYLLSVAMSNRQSVINAVTNVAAIGISLNPARKQAYLVPRDKKVCLDISYIGLVDLATQSGSIVWAKAELVYEQDSFQMGQPGTLPEHKFNPFSKERGDVIGAYVVAKTPGGEYMTDAMSITEINAIRDRSSAWKAYQSKGVSCPWVTDPGEMAKKGLAIDTPIPTQTGWTTMGDIKVGDVVFDMHGRPVVVKATSEIKNLQCFKITLQNGDEIICDDEHRWVARCGDGHASRRPYSVMTINDMFAAKARGESVTVPIQGAISMPETDLPVDPYLFGYWLGDGSSWGAQITVGDEDLAHLLGVIAASQYEVGSVRKDKRGNVYSVSLIGGFRKALNAAGVIRNKHIPAVYLRASIEQRRALLAGLMDSDGHIDKPRGRAHFYNKNKALSDAVYELACSLGETPHQAVRKLKGFGIDSTSHFVGWKPTFCPCVNPRKSSNYIQRKIKPYRAVASIEMVQTVPTRCIAVTGITETFLAGRGMVPTHNTVIKRASKLWPKNERLNMAIQHLNVEMDEGIEFNSQSRSGGAEVANKALDERRSKVKAELIEKLEHIAKTEGEKSMNEKIAMLNKSHLSLIESDIQRITEIAKASDAAIIEGENKEAANV